MNETRPSIETWLGRTLAVSLLIPTWFALWWDNHPVGIPSLVAAVVLVGGIYRETGQFVPAVGS
jgi:branched-subunit amino acid transport protein AzlD